jgi:hypothetical protein
MLSAWLRPPPALSVTATPTEAGSPETIKPGRAPFRIINHHWRTLITKLATEKSTTLAKSDISMDIWNFKRAIYGTLSLTTVFFFL